MVPAYRRTRLGIHGVEVTVPRGPRRPDPLAFLFACIGWGVVAAWVLRGCG